MAGNLPFPDIPVKPDIPSLPDLIAQQIAQKNDCLVPPPGSEQFSKDVYDEWGVGGVVFLTVPPLLSLIILILFGENVSFIIKNSSSNPHHLRKNIIWVLSIQPIVMVLASIAILMPRANVFLTALSQSYVAVSTYIFYNLLMELNGGAALFVEKTKELEIRSNHIPFCCLCCLPKMTNSRKSRTLGKLLVVQYSIIAPLSAFITVLLKEDLKLRPPDSEEQIFQVNPLVPLTFFRTLSVLVAFYGLLIIAKFTVRTEGMEAKHKVRGKTVCMLITNAAVGLAPNFLSVLDSQGVFPCVKPLQFIGSTGVIINYTIICQCFLVYQLCRRFYRREKDFIQQKTPMNATSLASVENKNPKLRDDSITSKSSFTNRGFNSSDIPETKHVSDTTKEAPSELKSSCL